MCCSEDVAILKQFVEKDRIYDFLAGLNSKFDAVRVQILGREDLPSLNETISIIRVEEGWRSVILETYRGDSLALVTKTIGLKVSSTFVNQANQSKSNNKDSNRDSLFCTYCKKHRHTKEQCWKLHGRPNRSINNRGQAHVACTQLSNEGSPQSSVSNFNEEKIEKLKSFLSSLEKSSLAGTSSLVFLGISSSFCVANVSGKNFSKNMGTRF